MIFDSLFIISIFLLKIIEKKAMNVWEQYDTGHIIEIMRVMTELKYDKISPNILQMISQWLALNIHKARIIVFNSVHNSNCSFRMKFIRLAAKMA